MSLLQYLSQRLLMLALVISVGIFYLVYVLYQWGLDDSTEFYLQQDMQWAKEIQASQQALPSNTEFKQFYTASLSNDSFPTAYKNLILDNEKFQYFFLQDADYYHYGLHEILADTSSITVVHKFLLESKAEGISLFEVSMIASTLLIVIMLIGGWLIYQRIARSMQRLLITTASCEPQEDFIEIENILKALKAAIETLENSNQQERLFIQTLSHELRTPMATIQVALELLLKKEVLKNDVLKQEQSDNIKEKLLIIFSSNKHMQHLSQQLLTLWTESKADHKTEINIQQQLQETIHELDQAFACQQRFVIQQEKEIEVLGSRAHVKLLLNNICKNAIVHSDSPIYITITTDQLIICNTKSTAKSNIKCDPLVAGSGIGLIIATRAAEQLGWKLSVEETDLQYQIRLYFNQ